jgi:hypothetical protein
LLLFTNAKLSTFSPYNARFHLASFCKNDVFSGMKASELARRVGRSRSHIARISRGIPGHRLTSGGHHYFTDCGALHNWILDQQERRDMAKSRKMSRVPRCVREEPSCLLFIRRACQWFNAHDILDNPAPALRQVRRQLKPLVAIAKKIDEQLQGQ